MRAQSSRSVWPSAYPGMTAQLRDQAAWYLNRRGAPALSDDFPGWLSLLGWLVEWLQTWRD
jgi:hypothetical protein